MAITLKSKAEIARMRSAGRIVAEVLALVEESLAPGISTADLDRLAERHIRDAGGVPSFLNYLGGRRYDPDHPHAYPASTCISVDVGVIYDGWHGDGARTFICGDPEAASVAARGLVETTRLAMMAGIGAAVVGAQIGDISAAVEDVAVPRGFGIVRQYVGHGIGTSMHEDPQVPNFRSRHRGITLRAGHCLAIEPMLTLGSEATQVRDDNWTVATWDGSLAAHFEHTIAVTADGPEILTRA